MDNKSLPIEIPALSEFLKAGVQFGHETKRWNPKMKRHIFGEKNGIHVIDVSQTLPLLQNAVKFLTDASRRGSVLFVGTKRQVSSIVESEAIRAGAYFVTHRWAGGLLTNFSTIGQSLNKLTTLEDAFTNGIEGRTKYEISRMKLEWNKLSRLYGGVKGMKRYPTAVVVVDPHYEVGAVVEARKLKIPVIGITDTNCDPDIVDYVIPGNDDAIKSVSLMMKVLADAVVFGNGGEGVKHNMTDFAKVEVKVIKNTDQSISDSQNQEQTQKVRVTHTEVKKTEDVKPETKPMAKIEKSTKVAPKATVTKAKKEEVKQVEISPRVMKALKDANLTLAKAQKMSKEELSQVKGLGEKAVKEILGK